MSDLGYPRHLEMYGNSEMVMLPVAVRKMIAEKDEGGDSNVTCSSTEQDIREGEGYVTAHVKESDQ